MAPRRILIFNIGFWLLAALVLFLNAWPIPEHHMAVAVTRSIYFVVVGLMVTSALTLVYNGEWFQRSAKRLMWVVIFSGSSALLTALIVNPLTYLLSGVNIHTVPQKMFSTGTLYFALFYFVWSALYFQLRGQSIFHGESPAPQQSGLVFKVEKMGQKRLLQDRDICCVNASGDYVELVTAANSYLQKETMAQLERQLDKDRFKRVHRSTIINAEKIESVVQKPGGAFEIKLEGGHTVLSSRSYKAVVESILPQA